MKIIMKALPAVILLFILSGCIQQVHQPEHNIFALKRGTLVSELVGIVVPNDALEGTTEVDITGYDLNSIAKIIVYSELSLPYEQLWVIPQDEQDQRLTNVSQYLSNPNVSPDGKDIIFESREELSGKAQIMIMAISSKKIEPFFSDFSYGINPRWSNNGQNISFLSGSSSCPTNLPEPCFDLAIASVDSRQISKIISGPVEDIHPVSWPSDSNKIAFSRWENGTYHLVVYDLTNGEISEIANSSTNDEMGTWSMSGDLLTFSRMTTGSQAPEVCVLSNGITKCVGQKDSDEITGILWTDDRTVLFGVYKKNADTTILKLMDIISLKTETLGTYSGYLDSFQSLR